MVICILCGLKIEEENLDKAFQMFYGELENGKFVVNKNNTIFYHIKCEEI